MQKRTVTPIDKKQKNQQAERKQASEQSGRGDTKKNKKQRNMTEERNIETENIFSVLQEDNQEPILEEEEEEEELPAIIKIDIIGLFEGTYMVSSLLQ